MRQIVKSCFIFLIALEDQPDPVKAAGGQILFGNVEIDVPAVSEHQLKVAKLHDIQLEQQAQSTDGIVLSKAFVRTEDGVSYVYKDDNGVLKKQIVKVKENVNGGAYVLVSGGLSMDDKIAFPYSKSIKEGMKTKEGSLDTFMGYDSTSYSGIG